MNTALDSFLDKWRQRWPEWRFAEGFIPIEQRHIALAWFSLLQEFEDIANITGDPAPADAKLTWWMQELSDWKRQRSRHPLGKHLHTLPAAWVKLADSLPCLAAARKPAEDVQHARDILRPIAHAIVQVENQLFTPDSPHHQNEIAPAAGDAVLTQWLAQRSQVLAEAALPSTIKKLTDWQKMLLTHWLPHPPNPRPRRLYSTLARLRLQAQLDGKPWPVHPLRILWHTWRSARTK